ncbi:hypothetical protein FYK55_01315 [Roseiconus nitratireducens]|uniref:Uncharacterized protein n=1 Tax=Roseiconus nitratireducens TaxID=2605748 RepID=A0A5M6DL11_9BACT|nr:hypothetical protein [Roseiconus nitratireducens]KAA5547086.1 hypothetical protein FYK55_01315 [Roseiconus nitratireducens]
MKNSDPVDPHSKVASEHYFDQLEDILVQTMHREAASDEGRRELIRSTGIDDPTLIDELGRLGVTADGVLALRLFPLVLVAWAEGHADHGEHDAVFAEARKIGIQEESAADVLLENWLRKRPGGMGIDAWKRYTHGVFSKMTRQAAEKLIELTEQEMIAVAKATGGHMWFGKISKKERLMIDRLVAVMKQQASIK